MKNQILDMILEFLSDFLPFKVKKKSDVEEDPNQWMPVKDIKNGIVSLKDGSYVKILEVIPVNFKLKSRLEKRAIILCYKAFLKACRFKMQICVQCKRADVKKYIEGMERHYKNEKNENLKNMIKGHIALVNSLGSKGAVSRRFYLVIPYIVPAGVKKFDFDDVQKQLSEKVALVNEHLPKCGNRIIDTCEAGDSEFIANILYTYMNKRTCEIQKFGGRLLKFTGLFVDMKEEAA